MQKRYRPPKRRSISQDGEVKPIGPHHCITNFGSVHAFQTNSRGASKILVITRFSKRFASRSAIFHLRLFHFRQNCIQLVETLFPEATVIERPVADSLYRFWPQRTHALPPTLR